jgi:hypothetical protein
MRCLFPLILCAALFAPPTVSGAGESAAGARNAGAPAYLTAAQSRYRKARSALSHARALLACVKREEARQSRLAMTARGQWIEPRGLWREKQAAEQNLVAARKSFQLAFRELNRARDAARRKRAGPAPNPVPLSSPFWWL